MRVGVFIEPWVRWQAGIRQFTEQMVGGLEQWGTHNYVLIGSERVDSKLEQITVPRSALSYYSPQRWLPLAKKLDRDIHLDWLIDPTHFGTYRLFPKTRTCAVVHDLTPLVCPEYHPTPTVWAHRLLFKNRLWRADHVVTVSRQTQDDLQKVFGSHPSVSQIYPGFRIKGAEKASGEAAHPNPYFLVVGAVEPRKNHKRIIEAFDQCCQSHGELELLIVGPEGWSVDLDRLIAASPFKERIHYLGFVSRTRLAELYTSALATLYPSLYEGFGFPVLEAMASGSPVITSNRGCMLETAGDAALLVDPESVTSIQDAMEKLVNDKALRDRLKEAGKNRSQAFSWKQFVQELESQVLRK